MSDTRVAGVTFREAGPAGRGGRPLEIEGVMYDALVYGWDGLPLSTEDNYS